MGDKFQALVDESRRTPDEWKADVLTQVRTFARLSTLPAVHTAEEGQPKPES